MRSAIVLIFIMTLLASTALGEVSGRPTDLDILGSSVNNTTIISPDGGPIEVNLVGSSATNVLIGHPQEERKESCGIGYCSGCAPCGEKKCYTTPWDDFTRPLCYPWSSYIPTRYNRQFIKGGPGALGSNSRA
ncbi:Uncharacterised protein [uncultured archaeon]|nr:Uncharacterised protein [uncultured archaeon]